MFQTDHLPCVFSAALEKWRAMFRMYEVASMPGCINVGIKKLHMFACMKGGQWLAARERLETILSDCLEQENKVNPLLL